MRKLRRKASGEREAVVAMSGCYCDCTCPSNPTGIATTGLSNTNTPNK